MKPVKVSALSNYRIQVFFEDGVNGIVDLKDMVHKGIFKTLQNVSFFNKPYIINGAIAWSEDLEIDSNNIYAEISGVNPSEFLHRSLHAAD